MKKSSLIGFTLGIAASALLMSLALKYGARHSAQPPAEPKLMKNQASITMPRAASRASNWGFQPRAISELSSLGSTVLDQIPSKDDIRGLSDEDVHQIARPIFEASLGLKHYADRLEEQLSAAQRTGHLTEIAAEGANFYEKCATRDDAPESIRAVCFIEFAKMSQRSGHPENVSRVHMPHDVLQIALEIAPSSAS